MAPVSTVDVVGVGLNATDTLIQVSEFPTRGSKTEYELELLQPGGQVASAMVACQAWGLRTRYVGKLGDDDAAALHQREFRKAGVEACTVHVPDAASPKSLILVDAQGERTVLCRRDERLILQPEELHRDWVVNARALLIDGHDTAAAKRAATWAREAGVPVIADLDEIYPGVEDLVANIDYLIVSREFPSRFVDENDLEAALCAIHRRHGCTLTAATLGPDGVVAWDGHRFHRASAYQVPVVDTTGAGDIFHAGFIFGLLQGWPLPRMLDFACGAAAMNCMAQGARGGIRPAPAIQQLMANTPRYGEAELASVERSAAPNIRRSGSLL